MCSNRSISMLLAQRFIVMRTKETHCEARVLACSLASYPFDIKNDFPKKKIGTGAGVGGSGRR